MGWEDPLEKEKQPTPVFLPGKSHAQRSLGASVLGGVTKESNMTQRLNNNYNNLYFRGQPKTAKDQLLGVTNSLLKGVSSYVTKGNERKSKRERRGGRENKLRGTRKDWKGDLSIISSLWVFVCFMFSCFKITQ